MMRWKLWQPKHDQDAPPSYAVRQAVGWVVLQYFDRFGLWQDVPLHIESKK